MSLKLKPFSTNFMLNCIKRRISLHDSHLSIILILAFAFGSCLELMATDEEKGLGLIPLSQDQVQHIEKHWPKIVQVRPNKIGAQRINEHSRKKKHKQQGKKSSGKLASVASHDQEIVTENELPSDYLLKAQKVGDTPSLPRYVNNSLRPSFPPIGDQGNQGSCVAWASTYYQASHEIGLLNGTNNKAGTANVLSPKWTYNILNEGQDEGLMILDAYKVLSKNGAASIDKFPYDGNYRAWDLSAQDWVSAISNRTTPAHLVTGLGGYDKQNLQIIKQLLTNGHVLTFGTYINSWVFTKVGKDPSNPNNPFAGQYAASWMNGYSGGHCMTIVGYNDDIWIDINQNGKVDQGEKGAFLIANSWGPDWGNNGFIWIAYDAFLAKSAVRGGPNHGRVPAGDPLNSNAVSVLPKAANYKPSLIAQFGLTQSTRNEIAISAGISDTTHSGPVQQFQSGALVYQGGQFEFDGSDPAEPKPATFAVDLTDLVPTIGGVDALKRFYLMLTDSQANNPTTLTSFSLIDNVHQKILSCNHVPVVCDDKQVVPYIDYNFFGQDDPDQVPPVVNITSPVNDQTLSGVVEVVINATDDAAIDRVELYVDSVLYATDTTLPYLISVNTNELSNGPHEFSAIAYDTSNNISQSTIMVRVNNPIPFRLFVNAGGAALASKGVTWEKDKNFTKGTALSLSKLKFENPVYNSERYGNFSYNFPVDNGPYQVKLKFAELVFNKPKKRVFSVVINGQEVISGLDLAKVAGYGNPYDLTFPVNVTDNHIKIDFVSIVSSAKISAIEITN